MLSSFEKDESFIIQYSCSQWQMKINNLVNNPLQAGAVCYFEIIEYTLQWQAGGMDYYKNKMAIPLRHRNLTEVG